MFSAGGRDAPREVRRSRPRALAASGDGRPALAIMTIVVNPRDAPGWRAQSAAMDLAPMTLFLLTIRSLRRGTLGSLRRVARERVRRSRRPSRPRRVLRRAPVPPRGGAEHRRGGQGARLAPRVSAPIRLGAAKTKGERARNRPLVDRRARRDARREALLRRGRDADPPPGGVEQAPGGPRAALGAGRGSADASPPSSPPSPPPQKEETPSSQTTSDINTWLK